MNVLVINSSPRKGNIMFMLDHILKDIDAEVVRLVKKKINFCSGGDDCCPKTGKCVKNDDMDKIYDKLEKADIVVLASPCYFFNVNALMKNFMDRCNPYYYNNKLEGKKFFLVSVGGYEPSISGAVEAMKHFVGGVHGEIIGSYYAVADKKNELEGNAKVIKELKKIGKEISKNG